MTVAASRHRALACWVALGWLVLLAAGVPDLRPGLWTGVQCLVLLAAWFLLARSRTLAWQSLAVLLAAGLAWAAAAGFLARAIVQGAGIEVLGPAAQTAPAAVIEQSLTLVPVLLLAVLVPARVRTFSVTDWLLAALTCGIGFQVVEALGRLESDGGVDGPALFPGGAALPGAGTFAGRPALAALVGASIGLAVAAWRHARKPRFGRVARTGWQVVAVVAPVGGWWLAVAAQAGWNGIALLGQDAAAGDPATSVPDLPWVLRAGWWLGGHGTLIVPLLVGLFVVALLVDGGRLRNAADEAADPLAVPAAPSLAADRWAGRLTRWAGTRTSVPVAAAVWLVAAGCAAVAYAVRDLSVVLVAHSRALRPGDGPRRDDARRRPERESRWVSVARGRAAGVMVRTVRAEAIALAAGPTTAATRRTTRIAAGAALAGAAVAVLWLGPASAAAADLGGWSAGGGPGGAPVAWLPGVLEAAGPWWDGLDSWQYALVLPGVLALLLVCAAPLDLASLTGRRSVWLESRRPAGTGAAAQAGSYLSASTPVEVLLDGAGAALGLAADALPGPLARSATRREVRAAVLQFATDPVPFIPDRRAAAQAASRPPQPAAAPARPRTSPDLPAVKLADGRLLAPLSADDERMFVASLDDLARDLSRGISGGPPEDPGPADAYRTRNYGDDERLVSLRPEKWSDGQNPAYGMLADVAYYDGRGASWYLPDTLPETVRHRANLELDRRLIELATVVYYPASPFRALEVMTNHPLVAQAFEERMARLAIPGYVVLEP